MNEKIKTCSLYVISGIVISSISTLYTQYLPWGIGVTIGYGLPLPWLEVTIPIALGAVSHYSLSWYGLGLLADVIFWSIVVWMIHSLYKRLRK